MAKQATKAGKPASKSEILANVANKTGLSRKQVSSVLDALTDQIGSSLGKRGTGVFVIPAVPYLQALSLEKDDLVQALGLSFTVSTVALAAILAHDGALQLAIAGASALALLPALAGMALGQWLRARARPDVFRLCFFAGLLLLGAHLAVRGFY